MAATDDAISIREYFDKEIESVRRDLKKLSDTIIETAAVHAAHHDREHKLAELAVSKADEALTIRLTAMNEFRQQITDERDHYPKKEEVSQITKRLEELIERNRDDLLKALSGPNGISDRLKAAESFIISSQAQMSTLRALMAIIFLGLAIAGFILSQNQ